MLTRVESSTFLHSKRPEASLATSATPYVPPAEKSTRYKDSMYESVLEPAGSLMNSGNSGGTESCEVVYQSILDGRQPLQTKAVYRNKVATKLFMKIIRDCDSTLDYVSSRGTLEWLHLLGGSRSACCYA